jgi:pyridoxine 4-oxidase
MPVGLIEAGVMPSDPDIADPLKWTMLQGRAYDWAYRTAAALHRKPHETPRKIVGGSSCSHAMAMCVAIPRISNPGGHRRRALVLFGPVAGSSQRSVLRLRVPARGRNGPLDVYLPDAEVSPVARAYMAAGQPWGSPA